MNLILAKGNKINSVLTSRTALKRTGINKTGKKRKNCAVTFRRIFTLIWSNNSCKYSQFGKDDPTFFRHSVVRSWEEDDCTSNYKVAEKKSGHLSPTDCKYMVSKVSVKNNLPSLFIKQIIFTLMFFVKKVF